MARIAPLALLLALLACEPAQGPRYRLEPPASPTAETERCLASCAAELAACREPAEARHRACEDQVTLRLTACERNAQLDYLLCARANDDELVTCRRRICDRPRCPTDALAACDAAHRGCFAGCGGRVIEEPG